MADGSIRLPTKIDLTGLKKGLDEMKKELKEAESEYAAVEKIYQAKMAEYKKRIAKGGPDGAKAQAEQLRYMKQIEQVQNANIANIEKYRQKLAEASAYYERFAGAADASKQLDQAVAGDKFVSGIKTQEQYKSLLSQTRAEMAKMEAHAARISAETGRPVKDILAVNEGYQRAANTANLLETRSRDIGRNIRQNTKELKKAEKATKKVGNATKFGIMNMIKMNLIMMGVMSVIRGISTATQEYMAVNTKLAGQMNTLKALWGQVLGPAIEWVINLLLQAVSAVNSFVYALSGINFVARANAAALKKQEKAAGGAAKAGQLAGFDEQTKLTDTSGGGGSSNPVELLDATVGALSGFAEKLKDQILAGDWFGAGETIGGALMGGIENVDWAGIGTKIGEILAGSVALLAGIAVSLDAGTIASSINDFLTNLFNALSTGIQNLNWIKIGYDMVDLLLIAIGILNPAIGILELLLSPGGEELTKSASELVGSIIGALAAAIVGLAFKIGELALDLWNSIKSYFDGYVDWEGTPDDIILGLLAGIGNAVLGIKDWIYNNIWVPFRDGFKKAFGIASPSKKMAEFGGFMMEGLKNGITGAISKVRNACTEIWDAIKAKFSNVGSWFKDKFSDAWQKVKDVFSTGGKIFDGIKEGIADTFKTIVNGLISGINRVISVPFNTINRLLNTIRSVSVLDFKPFSGLWSYNPLSVPQIPMLARGGIVNRPGRGVPAIIGEAGREAVLPLDNHTEWMDILADKIGGGTVTIPIYLEGKKMYTYFVDLAKRKAFAANGG